MLKKYCLLAISVVLISTSFAEETCPTVSDLQYGSLHGWQPLTLDNGTPVTKTQLEFFKKQVAWFALAEWMKAAPEGEAHCYYTNQQHEPDYLGVFLAKHALKPAAPEAWESKSPYVMQCHADIKTCLFN